MSDTLINWPPNDYIEVRTRQSFDAMVRIPLTLDKTTARLDLEITRAKNENYRTIVTKMQKYLEQSSEEVKDV